MSRRIDDNLQMFSNNRCRHGVNNAHLNVKVLILMDMPLFPYRIYAYNELAERGYELTVVSVNHEDVSYEIPLKFRHVRKDFKRMGGFVWLKDFSVAMCDDYDYVIITPNFRVLNFAPLYGKKYRERMLAWGHLKGCTSPNPVAAWIRRPVLRRMQALIFYEAGTRDEFVKTGFPSDMLFVANNTQYVDPDTVRLGEHKEYFLYVGRIQERKGLELALRAFAKVKKEANDDNLRFVIVGDGDRKPLEAIAQEEGIIEAVLYTGAVHDQNRLGEIFSHAIAYVSPGHVGLGVLHSMACGVPVITCTGRLHSVEISNCKEDNSLVVPYTIEDVAEAMRTLYSDKDSYMSEAAYKYYHENCTIDKMVDGIDNALKYVTSMKSVIEKTGITPPHLGNVYPIGFAAIMRLSSRTSSKERRMAV